MERSLFSFGDEVCKLAGKYSMSELAARQAKRETLPESQWPKRSPTVYKGLDWKKGTAMAQVKYDKEIGRRKRRKEFKDKGGSGLLPSKDEWIDMPRATKPKASRSITRRRRIQAPTKPRATIGSVYKSTLPKKGPLNIFTLKRSPTRKPSYLVPPGKLKTTGGQPMKKIQSAPTTATPTAPKNNYVKGSPDNPFIE